MNSYWDDELQDWVPLATLVAERDKLRQRLALATEFTISVLPGDDVNHHLYEIKVVHRGAGRWAVTRFRECLGIDGSWEYEPSPSNREDDWLETHRFDLDTAMRLATDAAPGVTVNGVSAAQVAERIEASHA